MKFMTPAEIQHATGLVRPSAQVRVLNQQLGVPGAYLNRAGKAVVLWEEFAQARNIQVVSHKSAIGMPDFAAMDNVTT